CGLVIVKTLVNLMVEFVVKSDDWCVRKGDAEVLEKWVQIAEVEPKRLNYLFQ
ncbi:hypothetical protein Tco_0981389, partial [Tanacetum coccineum]